MSTFLPTITVPVPTDEVLADDRLAPVRDALDALDAAVDALDDADVARETLIASRAFDLAREERERREHAAASIDGTPTKKAGPFRAKPQHEHDADLADADARIAVLQRKAEAASREVDRVVLGHAHVIGAIAASLIDTASAEAWDALAVADAKRARLASLVAASRMAAYADALSIEQARHPHLPLASPNLTTSANGRVLRTFTNDGARIAWHHHVTNGRPLSPHDELNVLSATAWTVDASDRERAAVRVYEEA